MQKSLHLRVCLPYVLAMVQKSHILFPPDGLKFIYTLFTENANLVLSPLIWKSLCNCWVVINDFWRLKNLELTLSTNSMKFDAALMHTVHAYAHPCMHSLNFNNYRLSNHKCCILAVSFLPTSWGAMSAQNAFMTQYATS